jgi:hypothetical protein
MTIDFTLTEDDFLEALRMHRGVWAKLLTLWGLLLIALGLISLIANSKQYSNYVVPILAGFFILFGLKFLARRSFRRDLRLQQPLQAVISDSGIEISSPTGSSKQTWDAFIRYVESKNLFLLYQGPQMFNVIPKRAFAQGEEDTLRSILAQRLGTASKARRKLSPRLWLLLAVVAVAAVLLMLTIRNILGGR